MCYISDCTGKLRKKRMVSPPGRKGVIRMQPRRPRIPMHLILPEDLPVLQRDARAFPGNTSSSD